jgi:hypothetical protein
MILTILMNMFLAASNNFNDYPSTHKSSNSKINLEEQISRASPGFLYFILPS